MDGKTGYRWLMLAFLLAINIVVNGMEITSLSAVFPMISTEYKLNYAQLSYIWGAMPLGVLLFSIIGGIAADRYGMKKVIAAALIWAAIFGGLRGFTTNYQSLIVCMFLIGVGGGFIIPNLNKGVAMWFEPGELSRANGILLMGITIGMAMGFALGSPLAGAFGGWRNLMVVLATTNLAISILWMIAARERVYPRTTSVLSKSRTTIRQNLRRVFRVKEMWLICLTEMFVMGTILTLAGIWPTFFVSKGMSAAQAGAATSLTNFASLPGLFIGPYLSDKIGLRRIFTWPFILTNSVMIVLTAVLWGWPLYLVLCLSGFLAGCSMPQLRTIIVEISEIGPALAGSAYGGIFTFNRIGGWLVPWIVGTVITITGKTMAGFVFCAVADLIPVGLILAVRETGHRAASKGETSTLVAGVN